MVRLMRATSSDLRDLLFEKNMRQILGPRCGLAIAMMRRIGRERGIMTHIESVVAEYAAILPHDPEHVDLDHNRPRLVVIEGGRGLHAVNDDDAPSEPGDAG